MRKTDSVFSLALAALAISLCVSGMASADHDEVLEFQIPSKAGSTHEIAAGPDGNLWVSQQKQDKLVRVSTSGEITLFDVPPKSGPHGLRFDKQGRMWVTFEFTGKNSNVIGRLEPETGEMKVYQAGQAPAKPIYISAGPDGNMWFTELTGDHISRITQEGKVTRFQIPFANARSIEVFTGPKGKIY